MKVVFGAGMLGVVACLIEVIAVARSGGSAGTCGGGCSSSSSSMLVLSEPATMFFAATQENVTVATVGDIVSAMAKMAGELDR